MNIFYDSGSANKEIIYLYSFLVINKNSNFFVFSPFMSGTTTITVGKTLIREEALHFFMVRALYAVSTNQFWLLGICPF